MSDTRRSYGRGRIVTGTVTVAAAASSNSSAVVTFSGTKPSTRYIIDEIWISLDMQGYVEIYSGTTSGTVLTPRIQFGDAGTYHEDDVELVCNDGDPITVNVVLPVAATATATCSYHIRYRENRG